MFVIALLYSLCQPFSLLSLLICPFLSLSLIFRLPLGYGFVTFDDRVTAQNALRDLNGKKLPNNDDVFIPFYIFYHFLLFIISHSYRQYSFPSHSQDHILIILFSSTF